MQDTDVQGVAAQLEPAGSTAYSTLFPTTTALQLASQSSQPSHVASSAPFTAQSGMQQSLAGDPAPEDTSLQHQYLDSPNPSGSSQLTYFPTMQQQQQQYPDVISAVPAPLVQQQAPQLALWADGNGQEYQQHMQQSGVVSREGVGGLGEVAGLAGDQRVEDDAQADQAAVAAYKQWSNNYEAQLVRLSRLTSGQNLLYCIRLADVHTWHTA